MGDKQYGGFWREYKCTNFSIEWEHHNNSAHDHKGQLREIFLSPLLMFRLHGLIKEDNEVDA